MPRQQFAERSEYWPPQGANGPSTTFQNGRLVACPMSNEVKRPLQRGTLTLLERPARRDESPRYSRQKIFQGFSFKSRNNSCRSSYTASSTISAPMLPLPARISSSSELAPLAA